MVCRSCQEQMVAGKRPRERHRVRRFHSEQHLF
jgi:hypothetical protein